MLRKGLSSLHFPWHPPEARDVTNYCRDTAVLNTILSVRGTLDCATCSRLVQNTRETVFVVFKVNYCQYVGSKISEDFSFVHNASLYLCATV
jgi:hypothetical protein